MARLSTSTLAALSALYVAWAFDSAFPFRSRHALADAVGRPWEPRMMLAGSNDPVEQRFRVTHRLMKAFGSGRTKSSDAVHQSRTSPVRSPVRSPRLHHIERSLLVVALSLLSQFPDHIGVDDELTSHRQTRDQSTVVRGVIQLFR